MVLSLKNTHGATMRLAIHGNTGNSPDEKRRAVQ